VPSPTVRAGGWWCFDLPALIFLLYHHKTPEGRGLCRRFFPFCPVKLEMLGWWITDVRAVSPQTLLPTFISKVNFVTGASGTASNVFLIRPLTEVDMAIQGNIDCLLCNAATRSGSWWLDERRYTGPSMGSSRIGVVAFANP